MCWPWGRRSMDRWCLMAAAEKERGRAERLLRKGFVGSTETDDNLTQTITCIAQRLVYTVKLFVSVIFCLSDVLSEQPGLPTVNGQVVSNAWQT